MGERQCGRKPDQEDNLEQEPRTSPVGHARIMQRLAVGAQGRAGSFLAMTRIPSSTSCAGVTDVGAPDIGSMAA